MEANRQTRMSSSLPVIASVAIIVAALFLARSPLESSRPEAPSGLTRPVTEKGKVEARLWQDPLKVALDHEKTVHEKVEAEDRDSAWICTSEHCVNRVGDRIARLACEADARRSANPDEGKADPNVPTVQVLLIIIRDCTFAEDHERRLRNRYSVLTALRASGFAPEDSEHIQYFKLNWPGQEDPENTGRAVDDSESLMPLVVPYEWFERETLYPAAIEDKSTDRLPDERPENILVVWLARSAFSNRPLMRLAQTVDEFGCDCDPNVRIDVIGPSRSTTLRAMLQEIAPGDKDSGSAKVRPELDYLKKKLQGLTIFSPWSTASPALLVDPNLEQQDCQDPNSDGSLQEMFAEIPKKFKAIGVNFVRMIGSDDLLALELIRELDRRGVDLVGGEDHVALISEWDTFYGKAFPLTFATMMESINPESLRNAPNWISYTRKLRRKMPRPDACFPRNLHTYSYIRGVDGKSLDTRPAEGDKPNESTESDSKWGYSESLELPIGRGQLDYVRRLAQNLRDQHKRGTYELKAIGVVGSDVYDKLILLHALREQLGHVILFTIDLDARMIHHEQFGWTRNVIVASNYGLEPNQYYKRTVYQKDEGTLPPFRDNYQTALFFACRTALGLRARGNNMFFREMCNEQLTEVLSHPRLFEIGRGRAVDISVDNAEIHPPRHNLITDYWSLLKEKWRSQTLLLVLLGIVSCVLLLVQISSPAMKILKLAAPKKPPIYRLKRLAATILKRDTWKRETLRKWKTNALKLFKPKTWETKIVEAWTTETLKKILAKPKAWNWPRIGVRLTIAAVVLFVALVSIDHYRARGEPFSLVAGVSIWPGEALRLIAAILSLWFIAKSLRDLRDSEEELSRWFNPKKPDQLRQSGTSYTQWCRDQNLCRRRDRLNPRTWWRYQQEWISIRDWATDKWETIEAEKLWKDYLARRTVGKHFFRLIPMSLAYVGLAAALMLIFGPPRCPYRGCFGFWVDVFLLFLSAGLMIILIFFVVDATRLSLKFIRNLKVPKTKWPPKLTLDGEHEAVSLTEDSAEWLDIRFIARLTEAVGKLIYYPFIVLLIMFVARNPYFDNWDFPVPLIAVFLLNSTFALICAGMLRRQAEKTRRMALDRLQKELVVATAAGDGCGDKHLCAMIDEVKSIRQGAYSPFTENPVLHAILIPSGGVSLLALLRFLLPA